MKEIARFYEAEEAQIAVGYLRAQGFDVQLADERTLGAQPHLSIGLGGYRLLARQQDAHMASIALDEVRGEPSRRPYLTGQTCEACGEERLTRIRDPLVSIVSFMLSFGGLFPFAPATKNLRCTACGHRQPAEPDEEEA
ncbi:hypothetical protein [Parvularcula marina]|uniref:hypothetical protein n=1 Tax=Parvularcula marina TaxID=2292771 RepID=UPI003513F9AA